MDGEHLPQPNGGSLVDVLVLLQHGLPYQLLLVNNGTSMTSHDIPMLLSIDQSISMIHGWNSLVLMLGTPAIFI